MNNNDTIYKTIGLNDKENMRLVLAETLDLGVNRYLYTVRFTPDDLEYVRNEMNNTNKLNGSLELIKNLCDKINEKLYIIFTPIKLNLQNNAGIYQNDIQPYYQAVTNTTKIPLNCGCDINNPNSNGCTKKWCNKLLHDTFNYKNPIQFEIYRDTKEFNTDRKSSLYGLGYKLYKGDNFEVLTKSQLMEKFNITNIDDYIIDKKRIDSINLENHFVDWINNINLYYLPWQISVDNENIYDLSEYFHFVDMLKLRRDH